MLIFTFVQGQDTVCLNHTYYTTYFSKSKHYPVLTEWYLTKAMISCNDKIVRSNKFTYDPLLKPYTNLDKDYRGAGVDRGHQMSFEDNACNALGSTECFYFSNMSGQEHSLNIGAWKTLEGLCRTLAGEYDSIFIWTGNIGNLGTFGVDKVVKPEFCFKVYYVKKTGLIQAYLFRNDTQKKTLEFYKVDVKTIEQLTNYKFNVLKPKI